MQSGEGPGPITRGWALPGPLLDPTPGASAPPEPSPYVAWSPPHRPAPRARGSVLVAAVVVTCLVAVFGNAWHYGSLTRARLDRNPVPVTAGRDTGAAGTAPTGQPSQPTPSTSSSTAPLALDDACRSDDHPATGATFPAGDGLGTDLDEYGDGAELQRLYTIDNGRLVPADGLSGVRPCDAQLWAMVMAVAPFMIRIHIDELMVFDADLTTAGTDDGYLVGEVNPLVQDSGADESVDPAHWRIALAPNGASLDEVAQIVAHEVGHLISLDIGQVTATAPDDCDTYYTVSGCLTPRSFLEQFVETTWSTQTGDDWFDAIDRDEDEVHAALDEFYADHEDEFVTRYAASAPEEDFAETFGYWCAFGAAGARKRAEGDAEHGADKIAWMEAGSAGMGDEYADNCAALRALTR